MVVRAKKIIADGFGDAGGKDAFDAALRAARSADTDTGLEPVAGKNAAATTSEPREASVPGGKVIALGAGALFLAGGYVARRTFWS